MTKLLIIDDNDMVLEMLSEYFFQQGIGAICCSDVQEALNYLELNKFDFVLCDIHMTPSGYEVVRRIKEVSPHTSIAMMSGDLLSLNKTLAPDADFFLAKAVPGFAQKIRDWIRAGHQRRRMN